MCTNTRTSNTMPSPGFLEQGIYHQNNKDEDGKTIKGSYSCRLFLSQGLYTTY